MAQVRRTWLGVKNIKALAKQYELLAKDLEKHTQGALDYATEKTFDRYRFSLPGSLAKTADMEPPQKAGNYYRTRIKNTDERAIYVEYGTGLNGQEYPYPADGPQPEGSFPYNGYNSGDMSGGEQTFKTIDGKFIHSKVGTWAPYWTKDDRGMPVVVGYNGSRDGAFHYLTCGQPSQHQMYDAKKYFDDNGAKLAKYYFQQNGIKLKEK